MSADAALAAVMERVWPGRSWTSRPLTGGMTNLNWRVDVHGEPAPAFVQLMMPAEQAHDIGISRSVQSLALEIGQRIGAAPRTIALLDDPAAIVTEFAEGRPLPASGPERERGLRDVVRMLRRLHDEPVGPEHEGLVSDPFAGGRWIVARASEVEPERVREQRWAVDLLGELESLRGPYERSLLHCDLSANNILVGERTTLIDWEYAGLGDRWSDLGDLAIKCDLDELAEELAVREYLGAEDPLAVDYVRIHRFCGMFRESFWALAAGAAGYSSFDHRAYAAECFARLAHFAASDSFRDACDRLRFARLSETRAAAS